MHRFNSSVDNLGVCSRENRGLCHARNTVKQGPVTKWKFLRRRIAPRPPNGQVGNFDGKIMLDHRDLYRQSYER